MLHIGCDDRDRSEPALAVDHKRQTPDLEDPELIEVDQKSDSCRSSDCHSISTPTGLSGVAKRLRQTSSTT